MKTAEYHCKAWIQRGYWLNLWIQSIQLLGKGGWMCFIHGRVSELKIVCGLLCRQIRTQATQFAYLSLLKRLWQGNKSVWKDSNSCIQSIVMGIHHKFKFLYVVLGIVFGSNYYGKYVCILEKQKKKKRLFVSLSFLLNCLLWKPEWVYVWNDLT